MMTRKQVQFSMRVRAKTVATPDTVQESPSAMDADVIKSRVVSSGSSIVDRAQVQTSLKANRTQSVITATFIERTATPLADFDVVARIAPAQVHAYLRMDRVWQKPR